MAPSQPSPSSAAPARPFDAVGEFLVSLGVARRAGRSARCGVHRRTPRCRSIKKGSEPESEAPPGLDHPSGAACRTGAAGNGLSIQRPRNRFGFLSPRTANLRALRRQARRARIGRGDGNWGGDRSRPSRVRIIGAPGCDRTERAGQWGAASRDGPFPFPVNLWPPFVRPFLSGAAEPENSKDDGEHQSRR